MTGPISVIKVTSTAVPLHQNISQLLGIVFSLCIYA